MNNDVHNCYIIVRLDSHIKKKQQEIHTCNQIYWYSTGKALIIGILFNASIMMRFGRI